MEQQPLASIIDRLFPSLTQRNFRLFWIGQGVSLVGTWMQNVGQAWLVLEITNSPFKLGLVSSIQFLPVMALSLFAGPFVDRLPKRKVIIVTQTALMILAFALSALTYLHVVRYWHVLVLALLLGLVNTIDIPTRQAFLAELAGRTDLMNAISLNSAVFNLARILGPGVAGLLIGAIGIAPCFLLNGLSFLAVIASLLFIDVGNEAAETRTDGPFAGVVPSLVAGLRYVAATPAIALSLTLMAALSTFVINYNVIVPAFAKIALSGDATQYGFLMTSMGVGSFAAGIGLAARSAGGPKASSLVIGGIGMSLLLAVTGMQKSYLLSCLLLALTGYFTIVFTASTNAYVQVNSNDSMRGRVMSVYSLVFGGVTPVGSLYAGQLVAVAGAPICMIVSGAIGVAATATVALGNRRFRRRRAVAEG